MTCMGHCKNLGKPRECPTHCDAIVDGNTLAAGTPNYGNVNEQVNADTL